MAHAPDLRFRDSAVRNGKILEYITVFWSFIEGGVSVFLGASTGSTALLNFGLDSFLELSSGAILVWRLSAETNDERRERAERRALRWVGLVFLTLMVVVGIQAIVSLLDKRPPEKSVFGIVVAVASLIVMPFLSRAKRKAGSVLHSRAMRADARQSNLCAMLAFILLAGLFLNALLGWWWADPVAGLLMIPVIGKEALEASLGRTPCCDQGEFIEPRTRS